MHGCCQLLGARRQEFTVLNQHVKHVTGVLFKLAIVVISPVLGEQVVEQYVKQDAAIATKRGPESACSSVDLGVPVSEGVNGPMQANASL